jgi:hypothetical protein
MWIAIGFLFSALATMGYFFSSSSSGRIEAAGPYANIISVYSAVGQLALAAIAFVVDNRRKRADAPKGELDEPTRLLARFVGEQCIVEVRQRGLRFPLPLQLRWHSVRGESRAAPTHLESGALSDELDQRRLAAGLVDGFRRLTRQRLLILGGPGAGKSTVALLFTLAALEDLARRRHNARSSKLNATSFVPVLLSVGSWRPDDESIRDFVVRRIPFEYPAVAVETALDEELLRRLFDDGRILPILDGLDEIPIAFLEQAIGELNDFGSIDDRALFVTCRGDSYAAATESSEQLSVDEIIVIEAIRATDVTAYLSTSGHPDRWNPVIKKINSDPDGALALALSTPLMASLARSVYRANNSRPAELCELATVDLIEAHLYKRLLSTVFPDAASMRKQERPLSILAYHLEPDLAWWELALAVPPAVVGGLITAAAAVVGAVAIAWLQPFHADPIHNALYGLVMGLAFGAITGMSAARSMVRRRPSTRAVVLSVPAIAVRDSLTALCIVTAGLVAIAGLSITTTDIAGIVKGAVAAGLAGFFVSLIANGVSAGRGLVPTRTAVSLTGLASWLGVGVIAALILSAPLGLVVGLVANVEYGGRNGVSTALTVLVIASLGIGVPVGVGRWISAPIPKKDLPTPQAMLVADRAVLLVASTTSGLAVGLAVGVLTGVLNALALDTFGSAPPVAAGMVAAVLAFIVVLCGSGSPWFSYVFARAWFAAARRRMPWNLIRFLDDANTDILRNAGPVYQFRHARLRSFLSDRYFEMMRPTSWLLGGTVVQRTASAISTRRRGWVAVVRASATAVAPLVLLAGIAVITVPQLNGFINRRDARVADERARDLIRVADSLQPTNPDAALRVRIAAAVVDSDPGARQDLKAFLRLRAASATYYWTRTNRVLSIGGWAVTLDPHGLVTGWNLQRPTPAAQSIARGAQDITAVGETGWIEIIGLDGRAKLEDLSGDAPGRAIDIGADTDAVQPLGTTGWVVVTRPDGLTAWYLNGSTTLSATLSDHGNRHAVIDQTGWVVVLTDDGVATAWHGDSDGMHKVEMDSRIDALRQHSHDIVDLASADGSIVSQWDLSSNPFRATDLATIFGDTAPSDLYSTADGGWVFVDGTGGASAWNISATPPEPVNLSPDPVTEVGPADWAITTDTQGTATAWNMQTTPPTSLRLNQPVTSVSPGPADWLVLNGRAASSTAAWNLTASPPGVLPLGTQIAGTEVADLGWLIVRVAGRPTVAWQTSGAPPRSISVGDAVSAQIGGDGRWAVVTYEAQPVENMTAVGILGSLDTELPPDAEANPVAYACSVVHRGLTRTEWKKFVKGQPYVTACV